MSDRTSDPPDLLHGLLFRALACLLAAVLTVGVSPAAPPPVVQESVVLPAGYAPDTSRTLVALLTRASWERETVAPGVHWRRHAFDSLFGSPQSLNLLEVDLATSGVGLRFATAEGKGETVSAMAERNPRAVAAVNGSFFNRDTGQPIFYLRVDDRVLCPEGGPGALLLGPGEKISILARPEAGWATAPPHPWGMASKQPLVLQGRVVDPGPSDFARLRHPRTAVGLLPGRRVLLMTVDGRTPPAGGMTLREVTQTMLALGCNEVLNLDGGGSTTLWLRGKPFAGVVSYPSDNGRYDHEGARICANAVVVEGGVAGAADR